VKEQERLEEKKTALSEYDVLKPKQAGQLHREIMQYTGVQKSP